MMGAAIRCRSSLLALGAALALGSWASPAEAYVQTQTCFDSGPAACVPGQTPLPVEWKTSRVSYTVYGQSKQSDEASSHAAVQDGFEAWNRPECGRISLEFGGLSTNPTVGFSPRGKNENVVIFQDEEWDYSPGVIGLTSVSFNPNTGEIVDADMELNNVHFQLTTTDSLVRSDVANTVTHEAGHFIGLDHSNVQGSTMWADARLGETEKRTLESDDIEGLCAIYPASGACQGDECEGSETVNRSKADSSCSVSAPGGGGAPVGGALLLLLGFVGALWRRRSAALGVGLGVSAASLCVFAANPAEAYVRTVTCTSFAGPAQCEAGEEPLPVYWSNPCVVYHLNDEGSIRNEDADTFAALEASFEAWNTPDCSYIRFINGGFTSEDRVGYNPYTGSEGNANIVVFRNDSWDYDESILALTSVTFRPSTGEILDADIELNEVDHRFTTTDQSLQVIIDVANTVTHEAGHFLGLDHSSESESTMFATAPIRETHKRSLHGDDELGLCAIYPNAEKPSGSACAGPGSGFFEKPEYGPEDGPPPVDPESCACSSVHQKGKMGGNAWLLLLLGAVCLGANRRLDRG